MQRHSFDAINESSIYMWHIGALSALPQSFGTSDERLSQNLSRPLLLCLITISPRFILYSILNKTL